MSKNEFLSLNGEWDLYYVDPGVGEDIGLHREEEPHLPAIPASVPGEVHLDLKRAGKIPDPYYGRNAELCRWMDEKDWWYRRRFKLDRKGKKVFLKFKGLDTFATVYLNGERIGRAITAVIGIGLRSSIRRKRLISTWMINSSERSLRTRRLSPVTSW